MMVNTAKKQIPLDQVGLRRRNRQLALLMEMSEFLSSARDLDQLLAGALSRVILFFRFRAGRIYLKDEHSPYLLLAAHQGMEPEGFERVHVNEGFTGKSYRVRSFLAQPVSGLPDKGRAALLADRGLKYIICIPLIHGGKVGGVMNLAAGKTVRVDQQKVDLLTAVGNQIAVAANQARLFDELSQKLQVLREKKEMIKFFAYSVSHDLKSPALGIYGLARRLKEKWAADLDEKGKATCDQILSTAEHMVTLVEKINSYIATRESPLCPESIDLGELLNEIREEFGDALKREGVHLVLPEGPCRIQADRVSLIRLFRNLTDNALKYGGESMDEIRVQCEDDGAHRTIRFRDNGVGIPVEDQERVFRVFHRNSSSRGVAGSGLGLAIVKEIVERHGGRICLESGTDQGTTFHITIPKEFEKEEKIK